MIHYYQKLLECMNIISILVQFSMCFPQCKYQDGVREPLFDRTCGTQKSRMKMNTFPKTKTKNTHIRRGREGKYYSCAIYLGLMYEERTYTLYLNVIKRGHLHLYCWMHHIWEHIFKKYQNYRNSYTACRANLLKPDDHFNFVEE